MSVSLDTSVVLRLLTGEPAEQAEAATRFMAELESPALVSDLVISELYFTLRHHYSVPHTAAVKALLSFVRDSRVRNTGVAAQVLAHMGSASRPGLIDRLIHADYDRDGFETITFDRDFSRLPNTRLLSHHR